MFNNKLAQILLLPVALVYGMAISFRNWLYSKNLLKSFEFDIPTIAVGNLSVGGSGKTPHIEYLIRLLKPHINVATLSRGYGRKTKGYRVVNSRNNAEFSGDEPLQYKRKFPDVYVVVSESRSFAIPQMLTQKPDIQTILLDDAFQHRSIKPGLNILLTEFDYPFTRDQLLPSGRLREWRSAYKRADTIIVSKCPETVTEQERQTAIAEINPLPHQKVFFSYYKYLNPYYIFNQNYQTQLESDWQVLLISAIARTEYLMDYLEPRVQHVHPLEYADHHIFTAFDLSRLKSEFDKMQSDKKLIITTEKDAMRLEMHGQYIYDNKLPVFVLPVEVAFHFDQAQEFDESVRQFLLDFKV